MEFDITKIEPVSWNEDAFANLVLPDAHKSLLCSLIGTHHEKTGFDDFIRGKGAGLVVNLFGPPGVGQSKHTFPVTPFQPMIEPGSHR